MPLTVKDAPVERHPSGNVRPEHVLTYAECLLRMNRLATELGVRERGEANANFEAIAVTSGQTCSQIANDLCVLAVCLVRLLDERYPLSSRSRHDYK
jgi:hypothetical protein